MTQPGAGGLSLRGGMELSGMSYPELWLLYVGLGGDAASDKLAERIAQDEDPATPIDAFEHNLIAHALNEHFLDLDQGQPVGYREATEQV